MNDYLFDEIETRWQKRWSEQGAFEVAEDPKRPKFYCLEMLPYPSGDIHVGHVRNYCITDVVARYKTMRGFNVLHPIGWDALGLPAENAAIKRGVHPERWTRENIAGMKRQLQRLGFSYPWSREIATCDPEYYRWNQWFFLRMLEKGIAYRAMAPVNWCPNDKTVLANEQAEGGVCWRCHGPVEQRDMEQWFLRITAYQDQLLDDMAKLPAWPERVLVQQRNWVGRSPGAEVDFPVEGAEPIRVFTTRIDTIYGATFLVLAPEHPRVDALLAGGSDAALRKTLVARLRAQDRRARLEGQVEKEGVFTGRYATNPFNGEKIPIWVGNFVLMGYGTGAIMSVPAHDQRDFEFARKYEIPIRIVIQPEGPPLEADELPAAYDGPGRLVNSGEFDDLGSEEAIPKMAAYAAARGFGKATVTYRLKDWLISRQRYWALRFRWCIARRTGCSKCRTRNCRSSSPRRRPSPAKAGTRSRRCRPSWRRSARAAAAPPGARPTPWTRSWTRPGTSTATSRRARRTGPSTPRRSATGSPSTSTWGGSSTRSSTSSTRASGPRSCATSASSPSTSR